MTVGRGAQLVLGLAPDNRGLMPDVDVKRLAEFGAWVKQVYGRNLAKHDVLADENPETWEHTAYVELPPGTLVDRVMTREYLAFGQSIRRYRVEAKQGNQWKTVARGQTIGNKKIDIFEPIRADAVSLIVEAVIGEPRIAEFGAYYDSGGYSTRQ